MRNITNLPTFNFKWNEEASQFKEEGYILEVDVQYSEKLYELHSELPFLPEREKLKKSKSL